jgi:hypothetical protein
MDARETVQKGLDARKNVRAAEARIEQLRAEVNAVNDARFREHMRHVQARNAWLYERDDLQATVSRQRLTIRELRDENEKMARRERDDRQRRILLSAVKAVVLFGLLICARDLDLIVHWLTDSLLAFTATWLFCAVISLTHKKN